jgi:hypothetical protein
MDKQTKQEIWLLALGTSPSRRPSRFAALAILTRAESVGKGRNRLGAASRELVGVNLDQTLGRMRGVGTQAGAPFL